MLTAEFSIGRREDKNRHLSLNGHASPDTLMFLNDLAFQDYRLQSRNMGNASFVWHYQWVLYCFTKKQYLVPLSPVVLTIKQDGITWNNVRFRLLAIINRLQAIRPCESLPRTQRPGIRMSLILQTIEKQLNLET